MQPGSRACKDIDIIVFTDKDPFARSFQNKLMTPFFRRYMSQSGLCMETTREWFFYTPPPSAEDLVKAWVGNVPLICIGPEYLCASHFKALVENRGSSIQDFRRALFSFSDFDIKRMVEIIQKCPISEAFGSEDIYAVSLAAMTDISRARDRILKNLRIYYSERFDAGLDIGRMEEGTLLLLANGVGFMGPPAGVERVFPHSFASAERGFWSKVFESFGLEEESSDRIFFRSSEARDPETRTNSLIAIGTVLAELDILTRTVISAGLDEKDAMHFEKRVREFAIGELQGDFAHMHPLRNTFRGALRELSRRFRTNPDGIADALSMHIKPLAKDTKKIHSLKI